MLQTFTSTPSRRTLEFGIYRDGDNNLDAVQEAAVSRRRCASARAMRALSSPWKTRRRFTEARCTPTSTRSPAARIGHVMRGDAHDMSDESNLARFVARTLDNAEASGRKQTWVDLIDHGGGDGGGLQTSDGHCMTMPDIAKAISDGVVLHAKAASRRRRTQRRRRRCQSMPYGYVGLRRRALARRRDVASRITGNDAGTGRSKRRRARHRVESTRSECDGSRPRRRRDAHEIRCRRFGQLRSGRSIRRARSPPEKDRARRRRDQTIQRCRCGPRSRARRAGRGARGRSIGRRHGAFSRRDERHAVARRPSGHCRLRHHRERRRLERAFVATPRRRATPSAIWCSPIARAARFAAFGGADYSDAVGPTVHAPVKRAQIDPWASAGISETDNAFYRNVDQGKLTHALA